MPLRAPHIEKRITHVAVNKSSFILAVCFTLAFLVPAVVQLPTAHSLPEDKIVGRVSMLLLSPLMFGVGCYLVGLIFFCVCNFVAKKFGGIEIELDDSSA